MMNVIKGGNMKVKVKDDEAGGVLVKIKLGKDEAILLQDCLSTAYHQAENGSLEEEEIFALLEAMDAVDHLRQC
jgi:hypothetical protein